MKDPEELGEYELRYIAQGFKFKREKTSGKYQGDEDYNRHYNDGAEAALDFMIKEVSRFLGEDTFDCTCDWEAEEFEPDRSCLLHGG